MSRGTRPEARRIVVSAAGRSGKGEGMIIVTAETIAGQRITTTIGQIYGLSVRTRGIAGNIMAGLANLESLNGDAMVEFRAALGATRDEAVARMAERATVLGANAVVQMRFDTALVGHEMSEVIAYGTAVVIAAAT